jgi:hypothetical protein
VRYRYGAAAIARAPERTADVLYVVGGLYGNVPALDAVAALARAEAGSTICFNGDFNWFNVDDETFAEVNRRVLEHHATLGNVEAEFGIDTADAGCGCAYPPSVANEIVERSNRIHARLKATAVRQPALVARLLALPMVARYRVGDCRIGVVHGDADSLAGWRFDVDALAEPVAEPWIASAFKTAQVDVFASTHTCLPTMRRFALATGRGGWVVNNGAAGMPNLRGRLYGLCSRLGLSPSPHPTLHEENIAGVFVALVPVRYDAVRWQAQFLGNWPAGSPAWLSYFGRIAQGPAFTADQVTARAFA